MTKINTLFFAGLAIAITLAPELAQANDGKGTLQSIQDVLTGNIGTVLGLGLAAYGLWKWMMDQESWGIVMIIGGVAITAFPGFFRNAQGTMQALFSGAGASSANVTAEDPNGATVN